MNDPALTCKSPAKLNLFLHITGCRPDGYHELQTLFQLVDLCDTLEFEVPGQILPGLLSLRCDDPDVPLDNNLVLRAARRLREVAGLPDASASIYLHKRIPAGAGLGGGSSDAATTLLALNKLWDIHLSQQQLCDIGLELGADVPLFIQGESAWAEGVGEILEPMELPRHHYLIIWPGVTVSTAEIFSQESLTRDSTAIKIADFLAGTVRNDCEPIVRRLYPEVDEAFNWLGQYGQARLTGTGSCVFVSFENVADAETALAKVPDRFMGFVATGLDKSPALPAI